MGVDVLRLGIMAADIVACVGVVSVSDAPQPWPRGYYRQRSRPGWCGGAWRLYVNPCVTGWGHL